MKNKSKKHSPVWGNSLKYLPWDEKKETSKTEELVSETIHEWYDSKHRLPSIVEVDLINSKKVETCPECDSCTFIKYGKDSNGIQRYKCKTCNATFTCLTNTIFEGKKIPISEWIEFLIHLFEFHSIVTSSRDNRNAESTGRFWTYKVFEVLKHYQDNIILSGTIYLDEMYFPVMPKDLIRNKDGKKLKGISRNKLGVAVAFDDNGQFLLKCTYTSKPSDKSTWNAVGLHIKEGSTIVHDGERSHNNLIRKLKLSSIVYKTKNTKNLKDSENPLDPINDIHALAKRFMKVHGGYDRDNLQDWMNLICFILSKPENRYEKIVKFIEIALDSPIRVKYRDIMYKKVSK